MRPSAPLVDGDLDRVAGLEVGPHVLQLGVLRLRHAHAVVVGQGDARLLASHVSLEPVHVVLHGAPELPVDRLILWRHAEAHDMTFDLPAPSAGRRRAVAFGPCRGRKSDGGTGQNETGDCMVKLAFRLAENGTVIRGS